MSQLTDPSLELSPRDLIDAGLESLEQEVREVMECLREVLRSSLQPELAKAVPWLSDGTGDSLDCSPGDAAQVASIAFQLLDMIDQAAAQLLVAVGVENGASFADWPEADRVAFLTEELQSPRPFLHWDQSAGPEADAVRDCYRVLAEHRNKFGRGIGSLIVSMTRQLSDLLLVHLFAREAGLTDFVEGQTICPLQVVRLFETLDDLEHSAGIIDSYLSHPVARRSLESSSETGPPGELVWPRI